jgi:hypothetical protein
MFDMRTFYRKLPHENVWHFCRKWENWPHFGYGERKDTESHSVTFCTRCIQHPYKRMRMASLGIVPGSAVSAKRQSRLL